MLILSQLLIRNKYTNRINLKRLCCTMSLTPLKNSLRLIFQKGVESVNPPLLVEKELKVQNDKLCVRNKVYDLSSNCYVVGFGKCVYDMAVKVESILGEHLKKGILSVPMSFNISDRQNILSENTCIKVYQGAQNNLPDESALFAANKIKNLVEPLGLSDILLVLISGGGSALLPLPVEGIFLKDKLEITRLLASAGADICELNTVRKRLSVLKGGGLAHIAYPASVVSLILSDVIGDPLDFIASGPTVANRDPPEAALKILEKYLLTDKIKPEVFDILKHEYLPKTEMNHVQNIVIGNNTIALENAASEAASLGFSPIILSNCVEGLVSNISEAYVTLVTFVCQALRREINSEEFTRFVKQELNILKLSDDAVCTLKHEIFIKWCDRLCILLGGETTVQVTGCGLGGRNQELSLRFSLCADSVSVTNELFKDFSIMFLSAGTDGIDGPTSAAGAVAYTGQIELARQQNLSADLYLQNNDSFNFFSQLNCGEDLIVTGHTGVNVMDIHLILIERKV